MHRAIIFLIAVFLLVTCQSDQRSARAAEEARIEKEVTRRVKVEVAQKVDALEQKYSVRQAELRTIRAVGFILLAGGSLGSLIWLQRNHAYVPPQPGERNLQMPTWLDHFRLPSTRVLDLQPQQPQPSIISPAPPAPPAPQDAWNQDNSAAPHHRVRRRRRHRNRTHRNQDHDAPSRDR